MGQKLDELLATGTASVDDLARAGREDGMTLDETARKLISAGRVKKAQVNEGSPLPAEEQDRLRAMTPDERAEDSFDRVFFRNREPAGEVITGQQMWDANDGRSPFPDQMQRLTDGKYRYPLDEDGEIVPGMVEDVATGKRITTAVFEARRTLELAEQ